MNLDTQKSDDVPRVRLRDANKSAFQPSAKAGSVRKPFKAKGKPTRFGSSSSSSSYFVLIFKYIVSEGSSDGGVIDHEAEKTPSSNYQSFLRFTEAHKINTV
jgi:hypothetical protein